MKYNLYIIILLAIIISSCTKNSYYNTDKDDSGAIIGFSITQSDIDYSTKASASLSIDDIYDIGIFAFNTLDQSWENAQEDALPNLFNNIKLQRDDQEWVYEPIEYWPDQGTSNVSFFAYSPHHTSVSSITAPSADYDKGIPSIDYSVDTQSENHIDLMVSTHQIDMNAGEVNLHLNHALTKVGFKAKLKNLVDGHSSSITKIELGFNTEAGAVYSTATLDLATMEWDFLRDQMTQSITDITLPSTAIVLTDSEQLIIDQSGYMLMIPQDVAESALFVNLTLSSDFGNGDGVDVEFSQIELPAHSWTLGQGHNYTFTIDTQNKLVDIETNVCDWNQVVLDDIEYNNQQYYLWVEYGSIELTYRRQSYYLSIYTDHPDGFSASIEDSSNTWIRDFYSYSNGIYFRVSHNNTGSTRTENIIITAGDITRQITISQESR